MKNIKNYNDFTNELINHKKSLIVIKNKKKNEILKNI